MRKLIVGEFVTADGVVEAPDEWNGPCFDDMARTVTAQTTAGDPLLPDRGPGDEIHLLFQDGPPVTALTVVSSEMFGSAVHRVVHALPRA